MNALMERVAAKRGVALKRVSRLATAAAWHYSPSRRRIFRDVRKALRVLDTRTTDHPVPGGVWAISVVHDEMDVLPLVLTHLERQGVTGLVISDNGSTDGTREYLETYDGPLTMILATDDLPHRLQEHKMDLLAVLALERGAEWIVPFDADEFWYGVGGTLAEVLRETAPDRPVQSAHVHSVVRAGEELLAGTEADRLPKVAFRPHRWAHLAHGNHSVHRPGLIGQQLRILHFPYRSEGHFITKIRHGAKSLGLPPGDGPVGHSWADLDLLSDEELRTVYSEMLQGRGPWYMDWIPRGRLRPLPVFPPPEWPLG